MTWVEKRRIEWKAGIVQLDGIVRRKKTGTVEGHRIRKGENISHPRG